MAADVPEQEPTEHQVGNTLLWTRSIDDYPADEWTLTYYLRGTVGGLSETQFAASADGADYSVTVSASTTAEWIPGDYWLIGLVTSGAERFEVYRAKLTLTPDPTLNGQTFDARTYNERVLDSINQMIESGMIREVISYSYNGVSTTIRTWEDVFKAKAYFEDRVANEQGKSRGRKILTRFRNPQ